MNVPVYFKPTEQDLLDKVDNDREKKFQSRSAWFKSAAQFYLEHQSDSYVPITEPQNPVQNPVQYLKGLDSFLDSL